MKSTQNVNASANAILELSQIDIEREQFYNLVRKAKYRRAYELAKDTFEKFPDNRFALYFYAVALGDSEEWASRISHRKNVRLANTLLRRLLKRSRGIDHNWKRAWRNEYYWFSRQYRKQWSLGVKEVKQGRPAGNYAKGVAAYSISKKLFEQNRDRMALKWASKSIESWLDYFKIYRNYYNSYVWYAKALGLVGNEQGMLQALRKASKLSKRPLSYVEFKEAELEVKRIIRGKSLPPPHHSSLHLPRRRRRRVRRIANRNATH